MNNARLQGIYYETCLREQNNFPIQEYFPNDKRKAFVENMKRIAKEFHLEVIWKKSKDRDYD